MKLYNTLIDEKAIRLLNTDFENLRQHPPTSPNWKGYDLKETIFMEYCEKHDALIKEYQKALKELGMKIGGRNDFGKEITKTYPELKEQAKGKVLNDLQELFAQIFREEINEY